MQFISLEKPNSCNNKGGKPISTEMHWDQNKIKNILNRSEVVCAALQIKMVKTIKYPILHPPPQKKISDMKLPNI